MPEETGTKRGPGRPPKDNGIPKRPKRVPVGQARDVLTVESDLEMVNKKFHTRWVKDTDNTGQRILMFLEAGYEFATPQDRYRVAKIDQYVSEEHGTIIRKPTGNGEWLYLMKQPIEYHLEDKAAKEEKNREILRQMQPASRTGRDLEDEEEHYGKLKATVRKGRGGLADPFAD